MNACLSLFTVFSLRSFLEHTLQIRPGEPVDYQAHFTWGAVTQPVAVLATVGASVILRRFPESAAASTPLLVMSVYFMLDWASELRVKMLERQLNWSRLRLLEAAGLCASACISIVLAFWEPAFSRC